MKNVFLVSDKSKEVIRVFSTQAKAEEFVLDLLSQTSNLFKSFFISEAEIDWIEKPILIASFKLVDNAIKREIYDS